MTNNTKPSNHSERRTLFQHMFGSAYKLSAFILVCIVLLSSVYILTAPKIAHEHREAMLKTFNKIFPPSLYDNQPLEDTITISDPEQFKMLGSDHPVVIYRARKNNQPAGAIFQVVARNAYSGHITLLMAVFPDGQVSGVRVLQHRETPGLGDKIEERKDNWILSFNGKRLNIPPKEHGDPVDDPRWAVKKDGGVFDQFTGATVTPRAVVAAIKKALLFVHQTGEKIYE